jgi:hypothetical protein
MDYKTATASTDQMNAPHSIQKTPVVPWSSSPPISSEFLEFDVKESRVLFELKVLRTFLKEILAFPRTTSRVSVDSQRRIVVVEREQ